MKTLLLLILQVAPSATAQESTPSILTSVLTSAVIAGLVSALVSGRISLLLKDKEYKNDYYKRVIDKRIKAIEAVELYVSLFSSFYGVIGTNLQYHAFFSDSLKSGSFENAVDDITKYSAWYSVETGKQLTAFNKYVSSVIGECKDKNDGEI